MEVGVLLVPRKEVEASTTEVALELVGRLVVLDVVRGLVDAPAAEVAVNALEQLVGAVNPQMKNVVQNLLKARVALVAIVLVIMNLHVLLQPLGRLQPLVAHVATLVLFRLLLLQPPLSVPLALLLLKSFLLQLLPLSELLN